MAEAEAEAGGRGSQCLNWLQCGTLSQVPYECFFYILAAVWSKPLAKEICEPQWIDRQISKDSGSLEQGMRALVSGQKNSEQHPHVSEQELGTQRAEAFVRAFLKQSIPHMSQQDCESHLQRKAVILEYFTRLKPKPRPKKKSKGLSAKQRRELRLFDIKPEQQRYAHLPKGLAFQQCLVFLVRV